MEVLFMLPDPDSFCDAACFVQWAASKAVDTVSSGVGLIATILGGAVLWTTFIIARYILNGCSFKKRRR